MSYMEGAATGKLVEMVAGGFALLAFVAFIILSLILNYHWKNFEIYAARTRALQAIYFGVSAVLIVVMLALSLNLFL